MATRTKSKTSSEIKAEEASKARKAIQDKKLAKSTPDPKALAQRSAADIARAGSAQPKDDKQAKTIGVVARGNCVKDAEGYKGPGEFVRATREEIEGMRARGVLVDEGRIVEPLGKGPSVYIKDAATKHLPED